MHFFFKTKFDKNWQNLNKKFIKKLSLKFNESIPLRLVLTSITSVNHLGKGRIYKDFPPITKCFCCSPQTILAKDCDSDIFGLRWPVKHNCVNIVIVWDINHTFGMVVFTQVVRFFGLFWPINVPLDGILPKDIFDTLILEIVSNHLFGIIQKSHPGCHNQRVYLIPWIYRLKYDIHCSIFVVHKKCVFNLSKRFGCCHRYDDKQQGFQKTFHLLEVFVVINICFW